MYILVGCDSCRLRGGEDCPKKENSQLLTNDLGTSFRGGLWQYRACFIGRHPRMTFLLTRRGACFHRVHAGFRRRWGWTNASSLPGMMCPARAAATLGADPIACNRK